MKFPSTVLGLVTAVILLGTGANAATRGTFDSDGVLRFQYGRPTPPVMSCSVQNVCEILLQPGEKVLDRVAGDTVRWVIATGVAGPGGATPTIFFKPTDTCDRDAQTGRCHGPLQTNMIITTQQHNYEIVLKSDGYARQTRYGYAYPREASMASDSAQIGIVTTAVQANREAAVEADYAPPSASAVMASLHCENYRIVGSTPFTPTKVCNDEIRTYVQIPASAASPTFQTQAANGDYSLPTVIPPSRGVYTIMGVPDHIVLIGDVGRNVPHVDIFHNGAK